MDTKKVRTYFQCLALTALIVLTHSSPLTARTSNAQNGETNVANIDTQEISKETIVIQEVANRENTQDMINREEMIIWEDTAAKDIFHKDTGSGDIILDILDNKDIGSGDIDINESKDDRMGLGMDFLKDFIIRDLDNTELQNKNLKEEQLDAFSRDLSDSSSSSSETAQDGSISDSSSSSSDTAQDGSIESSRSSRERRSRRPDDKRRTEEKKNSHRIRIRPIALRQPRTDGSNSSVAHDFLRKYGYFNQGKPLELQLAPNSGGSTQDSMPEADAVRMFQSYYGLPQTGELDVQTLALMTKQRCGVADIPQEVREAPADDNPSQFNLLGEKWDHTRLTWRLDRPTGQLTYDSQRRALRDSLEMWRSVAPLEFIELRDQPQNGHVDINVQFGKRDHQDGYPFDGKGTVLAHAFGPGDGSLSGDLHVDDDEKWALGDNIGDHNDLFLVIVHELGHSLGLAHSRDTNAIMFPYYGFADKLGQDDIKAIQYLYGARIDTPITTQRPTRTDAPMTTRQPITDRPTRLPWTTRQPVTDHTYTKSAVFTNRPSTTTATPAECRVEFDHVIQDDADRPDVYTGFRGNQVLRFSSDGLQGGFPSSIDAVFPGAPSNAESIFTIPEKSATYFVKGNRVWKYVGDELGSGYPKDLNPQHFQETIRFVLPLVDTYGKRRIFVFGTTYFQEYNFDQLPPQQPRAHTIVQYWPYVTTDVKYAVMGTDNYIYLIRPNSHVMLDSYRREVPGGKKDGPPDWMRPACLLSSAYGSGSASSTLCGSLLQIVVLSVISLILMVVPRN